MSSKHTPGPWKWDSVFRDGKNRIRMLDGPVKLILFHDAEWDVTKADRALIAAAPDLLEACRAIADARQPEDITVQQILAAKRAIAKAEGK